MLIVRAHRTFFETKHISRLVIRRTSSVDDAHWSVRAVRESLRTGIFSTAWSSSRRRSHFWGGLGFTPHLSLKLVYFVRRWTFELCKIGVRAPHCSACFLQGVCFFFLPHRELRERERERERGSLFAAYPPASMVAATPKVHLCREMADDVA